MKKITLLILCIIILSGCSLQNQTNNTNEISQAEKEFGFIAETNFEQGLKKTIEWYLNGK